jgi:hypothetical protein
LDFSRRAGRIITKDLAGPADRESVKTNAMSQAMRWFSEKKSPLGKDAQ